MKGAALEGRHVCRRHDRVIDRLALRHVLEILLFEAERRVAVQDEVDRLAVILLDQLLEFQQRLVEGMVIVELDSPVQGDGLGADAQREQRCESQRVRSSSKGTPRSSPFKSDA